ncbi:MAG: kelch repeat-containing protein [Candidatus Limnocylindrales bacterium]
MNDREIELKLEALLGAAPIVPSPDRLREAVVRDRRRPAERLALNWHWPARRALPALVGLAATFVLAAALLTIVANRPSPAASPKPAAATFSQTGSLVQARQDQAAVLLPDGRVLVVGGKGPDGDLASAELYDPTTGTFSATGSMIHARTYPTATLLPDGHVLVTGGGDAMRGGDDNTAELYDPKSGTFSTTGSMAKARWNDTATLLPDGRVLIAGGGSGSSSAATFPASAELYDPKTGTFSLTGSMSYPRFLHHAILLPDGRVLIEGGSGGGGGTASAELYDPATGTFSLTGSMSEARIYDTATLLPDGRVLVAGGMSPTGDQPSLLTSTELYDPATGKFSATGSMVYGRQDHTATLLPDGRVLVAGGHVLGATDVYPATAELYDAATGTFSPAGSLAMPTADHTAMLLRDGRVLIAGGRAPTTMPKMIAFAQLYDPSIKPETGPASWGGFTSTGGMVHLRADHAATRLADGRVLIVGGVDEHGAPIATAELYDPATGRFLSTGSMAHSRDVPEATLLPGGRVLVTGGFDGSGTPIASAELYDPTTGTFSEAGSMAQPRLGSTATLLSDGRVLIVGGVPAQNSPQPIGAAEVYDPGTGRFTTMGSLREPRSGHTATLLGDGRVLIAGGDGAMGSNSTAARPLSSAELYDPATGTFSPTGSMAQGRDDFTATPLPDGHVLVLGGGGAEQYDPGSAKFGPIITASLGLYWHTATLLSDGHVLVAAETLEHGPSAEFGVYDPTAGTSRPTGAFIELRTNYTATLLLDGRVLVAGGATQVAVGQDTEFSALGSAELYDPTATPATGPSQTAGPTPPSSP